MLDFSHLGLFARSFFQDLSFCFALQDLKKVRPSSDDDQSHFPQTLASFRCLLKITISMITLNWELYTKKERTTIQISVSQPGFRGTLGFRRVRLGVLPNLKKTQHFSLYSFFFNVFTRNLCHFNSTITQFVKKSLIPVYQRLPIIFLCSKRVPRNFFVQQRRSSEFFVGQRGSAQRKRLRNTG